MIFWTGREAGETGDIILQDKVERHRQPNKNIIESSPQNLKVAH